MKARIKETGEIIDVKFSMHPNPAVEETYWWCKDKQESYHKWELDFLEVNTSGEFIDWEQRRYEIAKEVLVNIPADYPESLETKVSIAIMRADALIKELKIGSEK